METPRVVIFDLGKVLVDFDYGLAAEKFCANCALKPEAVRSVLTSEILNRYETGLMTRTEFYEEICRATGFAGDIEQFGSFFADIFTPIEPMVELHAALRARGVPTYIFSNTNDLAIAHIRHNFPFFRNFDGYILSYEVGAMKPEAKIYEAAERQSGHRGSNLLYIDDRPENLVTAEARGWQVILQETPDKTLAAVRQSGLLDRRAGG